MQYETVLNVPYLVQPTSNTCQSTCLKMFALYLAGLRSNSSEAAEKVIMDIWNDINTGEERPSQDRNSYENMTWWLEKYFAPLKFGTVKTRDVDEAMSNIVRHIDSGYPVMVSTNHERTDGHIILTIGYQRHSGLRSSEDVQFVCHDPYGKFNPSLASMTYGTRRYEGGMSLFAGGEVGPGKSVTYDYTAVRRIRQDKHSAGYYYMISVKLTS